MKCAIKFLSQLPLLLSFIAGKNHQIHLHKTGFLTPDQLPESTSIHSNNLHFHDQLMPAKHKVNNEDVLRITYGVWLAHVEFLERNVRLLSSTCIVLGEADYRGD